jgi:hypothetical protein
VQYNIRVQEENRVVNGVGQETIQLLGIDLLSMEIAKAEAFSTIFLSNNTSYLAFSCSGKVDSSLGHVLCSLVLGGLD